MPKPSEVSVRNRIGAHVLHSKYDSRELTKKARAASPASSGYWEREVDPESRLDPVERARRAEHARKAYFYRLALRSVQARQRSAARRKVAL